MEIKTNSSEEPKELEANWVDYSVSALKAALGPFPVVGPILAEVFGIAVPQQRIDRIAKLAAELERELKQTKFKLSEAVLRDEEVVDLLEEGVQQAARSLSDERRSYIAKLIAEGLNPEGIKAAESKHLLRILGELSDVEVIWLCSYREHSFSDVDKYKEFREKHEALLAPALPYVNSPPNVRAKYALQESYKEHLAKLGLVNPRFETDHQTDMPKFDKFTGAMEIRYYTLSGLGRFLLKEIGLGEDE